MNIIRPIAIHLPQFHPIPENDKWWGKGFTEWTNVAKAKPLFKGHYQPQLPSDLGFYDLRLAESRIAQIELAKSNGIYGFCYYHYWFDGKRLLNDPIDRMLSNPEEDFPFMLCWANESWTRRWDGKNNEILIKQNYSLNDDLNQIEFLQKNIFSDPRYIKIDNKPVFVIYNSDELPNCQKTLENWRNFSLKEGFGEIYLCRMERMGENLNPSTLGFDAAIDFQPRWDIGVKREFGSIYDKLLDKLNLKKSIYKQHYIADYKKFVQKILNKQNPDYKLFPGITPGWDNSARKKKDAFIFKNSNPDLYEFWLETILKKFNPYSKDENFLFINAWNEWAEGNHLEPCVKWGNQYLNATKSAFDKYYG